MIRLNARNMPSAVQLTVALVALSTLLHLLVMGRFELSGDEAHYALFAYHLDWSYFDHPPLVGWLLATLLPLSDSEFTLRLWPLFLSLLSSWLLYRLTRQIYPQSSPWVALVAVALLHSALVFQLLSLAMLPDTPLIPLGLAAAIMLHRAVVEGEARAWLGVGLLFGLAGLSKYTAVILVVSAALLVGWGNWRSLRGPWPWLGVALAALLITPVLWWNYLNDWISISYQLGHGMPQRAWSLERLGLSFAGQLLAYGPLLVVAGIAAGAARFRRDEHRFALLMALPLLLFFGWNSGYELALPHWTVLGWALLSPLAAHWLVSNWANRAVKVLAWTGALYSVLLTLVFHSALFAPWLPFEEEAYPLADLYGWNEVAQRAVALAEERSGSDDERLTIFAGNWSFASHIAWYARPAAVKVTDGRYTQNDIWFGSPEAGENGVLVVPVQFREGRKVAGLEHFASCEFIESHEVKFADKVATSYELHFCQGYRG